MRLPARLTLTALVIAAPIAAGIVHFRLESHRQIAASFVRDLVIARMELGGRARCEAAPATFPVAGEPGAPDAPLSTERGRADRPGPPPLRVEIFAYSRQFASENPKAPPFPAELRKALEDGASMAFRDIERDGAVMQIGLAMPWTHGPCAVVLAENPVPGLAATWTRQLLDALWLGSVLAVVVAAAAIPIVRRVRRLTAAVERAAAQGYETPVDVSGSDEIADLARAFNAAGAKLRAHALTAERREEALRTFVANTTHDVATPLTVLQGHLSALRELLDGSDPVRAKLVRGSLEEAHYMTSLLHNLGAAATLATLDAGERNLDRRPFDLRAVVERATARHRPIAKSRGVELDLVAPGEPVSVLGDATLVEQAVGNVIQNAVVYGNPGGHAVVVLDGCTVDPPAFRLRVIDDGPGVPEPELARLTERAFRGEAARARHPAGCGLGLAITRDVAARHGFDLALRRSEQGGLEVEIKGGRG